MQRGTPFHDQSLSCRKISSQQKYQQQRRGQFVVDPSSKLEALRCFPLLLFPVSHSDENGSAFEHSHCRPDVLEFLAVASPAVAQTRGIAQLYSCADFVVVLCSKKRLSSSLHVDAFSGMEFCWRHARNPEASPLGKAFTPIFEQEALYDEMGQCADW
jgi:hypothetical protein